MNCYKNGSCGVYENRSCQECPASKPEYLQRTNKHSVKLTEKEFYQKYCQMCGSQRCEGIGTEWFNGCKYKNELTKS